MQYWIVDVFSSSAFEGNPAAVCFLDQELPQPILQKIAQELNRHETVFISKLPHQHFQIQWFTVSASESICGHGLLAAAHVLWNEMKPDDIDPCNVYFDAPNGIFSMSKEADETSIVLNKKEDEPVAVPDRLINALGIPPISVSKCGQIFIVELFSVKQVMKLEPDIAKLEKIPCEGVVVTAEYGNDSECDFASRFFAPALGIKEDYGTLWTHRFLGPYWQQRLHKDSFVAVQSSQRHSLISVKCSDDKVTISGRCAVSAKGSIQGVKDLYLKGDLFETVQVSA